MDPSKKILILYASAGHGHEKAAKAILEACRELPGVNAQIVDTISLASLFFGNLYRQSYLLQIHYVPWLWGIFYFVCDVSWVYGVIRRVRRAMNAVLAGRLERLILEERPDVIIATHFLSVEVTSHLKEQGRIHGKLLNVITDYLPHHVWLAKRVDLYAVALPETKEKLMQWRVPADRIRVTGIPVEKKFLADLPTLEMRARLQLDLSAFTVLITSGGGGIGSMKNIVEGLLELKKPIQILAVCGTNQPLFHRLSSMAVDRPLLKVFGFVDHMQELMAASDLVIGKGGGLTITESFSQGKPIILFQSIPGQETRNAFCVNRHHAGFVVRTIDEIAQKVSELLESPDQLDGMKRGVREIFRSDASEKIALLAQANEN